MKMEEVELCSLRTILNPPLRRGSGSSPISIEELVKNEHEVIQILGFKLFTDTLYTWLELTVKLWDDFVLTSQELQQVYQDLHQSYCTYPLFKPPDHMRDPTKYEPAGNGLELGIPNNYRVII